jgi:hypothetical protein
MSLYEYERDGQRIERYYPIGSMPRTVRIDGKTWKLAVSKPAAPVLVNHAFTSVQIRRNDPDIKKRGKHGRARFETATDVADFMARRADRGDEWVNDKPFWSKTDAARSSNRTAAPNQRGGRTARRSAAGSARRSTRPAR